MGRGDVCLLNGRWLGFTRGASGRVRQVDNAYASADFELWTDQAKVVLLALMFVGYGALHPLSKIVLTLAMWIGRLSRC